ncbi:MAG: hypothetical protein ABSF67_12855 [Roseiarcus sp.]|jgi:hypothetical protein
MRFHGRLKGSDAGANPRLSTGEALDADFAILATGHDAKLTLAALSADAPILIVGSGLTLKSSSGASSPRGGSIGKSRSTSFGAAAARSSPGDLRELSIAPACPRRRCRAPIRCRALLERGAARQDALGIGFDVAEDLGLVGADGRASRRIMAINPLAAPPSGSASQFPISGCNAHSLC